MNKEIHLDFETYSEAGYQFNGKQWKPLPGIKNKTGIKAIGTVAYCEHPSTEILSMVYAVQGINYLWLPNDPLPTGLFNAIFNGAKIHAWNSAFEYYIWNLVGVKKYGFPEIPLNFFVCTMAKARAYALPSSLKHAAKVLQTQVQKKEGEALLNRFSIPKQPTKKDSSLRRKLDDFPEEKELFIEYNEGDVAAEREIHHRIPDLSDEEMAYWRLDQKINTRGIAIDIKAVDAFISVVERVLSKSQNELIELTDGKVTSPNQTQALREYINVNFNLNLNSLNATTIKHLLTDAPPPPKLKRLLEIRRDASKSSVKKLYALKHRVSQDGRLRNMYVYYGARTGRASGSGVQPQNIPSATVDKPVDTIINEVLTLTPNKFISRNPDTLKTVSACLRGLFVAPPGKLLIVSDFSAIEAVVLAMIAGEQWRIHVFNTHGRIYEESVSRITGVSVDEMLEYRKEHGKHHPLRKFGKVAELASGYQGGVNAWIKAGALEFIKEDQILDTVKAWRKANSRIVRLWYQLEECAVKAVKCSGEIFDYHGLAYMRRGNTLFCRLPSGRELVYHNMELDINDKLSFKFWNTNQNYGKAGWIRTNTYGGKLAENNTQAIARDLLFHAMKNLEEAGFPIVLHTHDEIGCEINKAHDIDTLVRFEKIMSRVPEWAKDWPIKAAEGFIAKRYRK